MTEDAKRWGEPMAALLGAYDAQIKLGLPSIGGKDSMSGSFNDIDVPPTLCSFAVVVANLKDVVTNELKEAGSRLAKIIIKKDEYDLPDYEFIMGQYDKLQRLMRDGVILSAQALDGNGIADAVAKMAFGNKFGAKFCKHRPKEYFFRPAYGEIVIELHEEDLAKLDEAGIEYEKFGKVLPEPKFVCDEETISMEEALEAWTGTLEKVFPTRSGMDVKTVETSVYKTDSVYVCRHRVARPKVFIPVFPGTNCEYDTTIAFREAGADTKSIVFKNMTGQNITDSVDAFAKAIHESQIVMFSGGFSAGDEPDGSAKFITSVFRNERIKEEIHRLLEERDGLILGICNGFQALVKLGLVPYGKITTQTTDSPTLTTNRIGRHISKSVYTKVVTNKSPWLQEAELGGVYAIPASHGEGRFVASDEWLKKLVENGQVATQYVDVDGRPTMDEDFNPNGSYMAIEGITSPDGRILGKMAHSERRGNGVAKNIYGEQNQKIFASGVKYFA